VLARLDALSHERSFYGAQLTLLDVLQTPTTARRCFHGPMFSGVGSRITNRRAPCSSLRCPICIHFRMSEVVLQAFRIWGNPDVVYARYLNCSSVRQQRRIRDAHPLHLVVTCADGRRVLYSPQEGDGVPATALDLLDTMLAASPDKGKRVFAFSQSKACIAARKAAKHVSNNDDDDVERVRATWKPLASHHTLASANAAYTKALKLSNDVWEEKQVKRGDRDAESAKLNRDLTEQELPVARHVLEGFATERAEELAEWRALRKAMKSNGDYTSIPPGWDRLVAESREAEPEPQPHLALLA
jgi:hypothetical protein